MSLASQGRVLGNLLRSQELLSVCTNRNPASAQPHINGCRAFTERYFALRLAFLARDCGRKECVIVVEEINEQHCRKRDGFI